MELLLLENFSAPSKAIPPESYDTILPVVTDPEIPEPTITSENHF
jgi:hypothetical protein